MNGTPVVTGPADRADRPAADVFARACPSRQVLETIASKWGILALAALGEGSYRFNALRRRVDGISEKMLAQTLHALERDGLVHRHAYHTVPPRVEYSLTPAGASVAEKLRELIELVERQLPEVLSAQARYDDERLSGWSCQRARPTRQPRRAGPA